MVSYNMNATAEESRELVDGGESPSSTDSLLTAEEVAALLQVTCSWVYAETRKRRIPHLRLGRYVRYRRSALEAWMEEMERSSTRQHLSRVR